MRRFHSVWILAVIATVVAAQGSAHADVRVGAAEEVGPIVQGLLPGQSWTKKLRDADIFERETITTSTDSNARLRFLDRSAAEIGPSTDLRIDRSVFNSNGTARVLVISVTGGSVRWTSGISPPDFFQIKTPFVSVAPVGTMFDLLDETEKTTVLLREGRVRVCSSVDPQRCANLSPGDMITGTARGLEGRQRASQLGPAEFANRCLGSSRQGCFITSTVSRPLPTERRADPRRRPVERTSAPPEPRVPDIIPSAPPTPGGRGCYRDRRGQVCCTYPGGRRVCQSTATITPAPPPAPSSPVCKYSDGRTICCTYSGSRRVCRVSQSPAVVAPPVSPRPIVSPGMSCGYVGGRHVCCTSYGGRRVCRTVAPDPANECPEMSASLRRAQLGHAVCRRCGTRGPLLGGAFAPGVR